MDRISDPDEAQRLALGVRNFDFDSFLGPYPDEQADSWTRLTYLITAGVLERSKVLSGQVQKPWHRAHSNHGHLRVEH